MGDSFSFSKFVTKGINIEKDDEKRIFSGHIGADIVDRQNEFVATEEILKTMDSWMDCGAPITDSHSNRIVGKGLGYEKGEYEGTPTVKISAQIYKRYKLHNDVWKEIKDGVRKGLSIGGSTTTGKNMIVKDGRAVFELRDLEVYEVAVCKSPANPLAVIDNVNEIAKNCDLTMKSVGDRNIIQCDTVDCVVNKSETEVGKALSTLQKWMNIGETSNVSNENLASQDPPENSAPPKQTNKTINYISNKTGKKSMSEEETSKETTKMDGIKEEDKGKDMKNKKDDVVKTDNPVIDLLAQSITKQNEILEKQTSAIQKIEASIEDLKKVNPAGEGKTDDTTPKASSGGKDSGAKVKLEGKAYQSGSDQAGINKPDESMAVPDKVKMVKKDHEAPAEEKKEEVKVEKTEEQNPGEPDPNQIIKMSNGYKYVKTQTPLPPGTVSHTDYSKTLNGYEIIKATENGWGKFEDAESSIKEMNTLFAKGEFGTGVPAEGVN